MPNVDLVVESTIAASGRAHQVCGMFDCPIEKKQRLEWKCDIPFETKKWNVGLIVGASGSGKTTIARHLFPSIISTTSWDERSIIDNFDDRLSINEVTNALSSVGFSTIPAWLRPFRVLSNGEQFRATMARLLIAGDAQVVVDEFTSVVDRQIAKIVSHSVQKYTRKNDKQFVAVSCHRDIEEWLQPDWIFDTADMSFRWRLLRRRPEIQIEIGKLPFDAWRTFSRYHYLTAELNRSARCFGLWANGSLAVFGGVLHRPSKHVVKGLSRLVTLPDWQGLGLGFVLMETLGAAYTALGCKFNTYPAHSSFVRAYRADSWRCVKKFGTFLPTANDNTKKVGMARPSAVFSYVGKKMNIDDARKLVT